MVRERGSHRPLDVARVEIAARIVGPLAETQMTITFSNPENAEQEGELYFPLPDGATVCGYGLDIEGKLVDGVVVERERGRSVYEDIVRGRIDPGLLEWVKGNTFRAHVYPIPPNGSRTVSVRYVTELQDGPDGTTYRLPLNFKEKVGALRLRVEATKASGMPRVLSGTVPGLTFVERGEGFVAETAAEGVALAEDLVVAVPGGDGNRTVVEKAPDGETFFCIKAANLPRAGVAEPAPSPRRITVFWDGSGSRETADPGRAVGILKAYLASLRHETVKVDFVVFRHKAMPAQRFTVEGGRADALVKAIEAVTYDGGTDLASLTPPPGDDRPELYLLFTDGLATLGNEAPPPLGAPVYAFAAGPKTDRALLDRLTFQNGGAVIDLDRMRDEEAVARIGRSTEWFLGAEVTEGRVADIVPAPPHPMTGPVSILGRLESDEAALVLRFGWQGHVTRTAEARVSAADAVQGYLLRFVWAREKVASLLAAPEPDEAEIVRLGKRYGVVTPHTSLIVLESLEQYQQYCIRPPATLPEMRKAYDESMGEEMADEASAEEFRPVSYDPHADTLYNILIPWYYRIALWEKTYTYPSGFRYEGPKDATVAPGGVAIPVLGSNYFGGEVSSLGGAAGGFGELFGGDAGEGAGGWSPWRGFGVGAITPRTSTMRSGQYPVQDLVAVVPRFGGDEVSPSPPGAETTVGETGADRPVVPGAIRPWEEKGPYLEHLDAAAPDRFWSVYLAERRLYGASPMFFRDCAEFFLVRGQQERGLQVLSNLAELGLVGPVRTMAYRVVELGMLDLAAQLFEELIRLRPEEPQHCLDLARVLEQQGKMERAIELLHKVVKGDPDHLSGTVEIPALVELNRLLRKVDAAAAERLGIDQRLVRLLDADLRVVVTWDADAVDVDLEITEPSGEVCRWDHAATAIGGQLWWDFQDGYGPEEYILRRAMKGIYTVGVIHAGQHTPRLFETVTVRVDVFTNYGRPEEKHETFFLRLRDGQTATVTEVAWPDGSGAGGSGAVR
jgi:tetratricopeptide (TPR) repeat protein